MRFIVIHQTGALSMVGGDKMNVLPSYNAFLVDYGNSYRTFKHGMFHGFLKSVFFVIPIILLNNLSNDKAIFFHLVIGFIGFLIVC